MLPYFVWNGIDSRDAGIRVVSYPPILRPPERVKNVTIPGRSGALTVLEGEHVYDPYTRAMVVANQPGTEISEAVSFLRGSGWLILGNDPDFAYECRMQAQLQMDKLYKGVWQGSVTLYTQPLKRLAIPEKDIAFTVSGNDIFNPGNVASRPRILVTTSGDCSFGIGDESMAVVGCTSAFVYDCETGLFADTSGNLITTFQVAGDVTKIPTGKSEVYWSGATSITITPRWRFV